MYLYINISLFRKFSCQSYRQSGTQPQSHVESYAGASTSLTFSFIMLLFVATSPTSLPPLSLFVSTSSPRLVLLPLLFIHCLARLARICDLLHFAVTCHGRRASDRIMSVNRSDTLLACEVGFLCIT